ncbi:bifunctional diaminohydroxyphosphoribosylaminopyrimidine deaminase/5-amino-6-(5-phosphoribosylamino)uracil reductase RibD [bacterium]|nr:bifunctional diaminohydroxyphosphoribosylaminopyrimidine deaminase/5-amino-6-(5-phosphoribosylamino)uracil reductase RibD [bacterium]
MNDIKQYQKLMRKCLSLAKKGEGKTSPNPLVGCVIFDDDFNIVSVGWHEKYGEFHAERNAILNYKGDLKGKNLIVNLEPCCHYGKTPPCTDIIIESGIKKVVVGMRDVNPIVAGKGIKQLQNSGIEVVEGVLENECKKLNEIFIKNQTEKKPFILIKSAVTLDGKIATKTNSSKWITGERARREVQRIRNLYDAILTSSNTVLSDNPSLTARIKGGKNPVRVVLDRHLKTSPSAKVYNDDGTKVFLFTSQKNNKKYPKNVCVKRVSEDKNGLDLNEIVSELWEEGIRSILVEAGGKLNGAFVKEGLADKLVLFVAPKILGDKKGKSFVEGFDIDDINNSQILDMVSVKRFEPDLMIEAGFKY